MKRIFCLIFVFVLIIAVASCGGSKKENPAYEEQVSKEIKAEEGGKVESSDGKTSIEIPADALDSDTKITMTIYDISAYAAIADRVEGKKVVSKVVEFEPSGIVFKKPVIITMAAGEAFENKIVSAAVFYEQEGKLSYSEHGAYGVLGRDAAGDPVMTTAAGDPIMLSDGNLTTGAGDPIMNAAAGDPIMMSAAGDPIMTNAAGDPIMNAAAGDPIMMATGHFTAYTFIAIEPKEPEEEPEEPEKDEEVTDKDEEPVVEDDDDEIADEDDDIDISDIEISDEDEDEIPDVDEDETPVVDEDEDIDTTPAEPPVYSKVLCTGLTRCSDGGMTIDCPAEGEEFYGQDAQFVAGKTCVLHKYSIQTEPVEVEEDGPEEGEETGLRNILHGKSNNENVKRGLVRDGETGETYEFVLDENTGLKWVFFNGTAHYDVAENRCAELTYGGHEWRLPTVKEFLSIADHDRFASAANEYYFRNFGYHSFWTSEPALTDTDPQNTFWVYNVNFATLTWEGMTSGNYGIACVTGEEYGKVNADDYVSKTINGNEVIFDSSTNLLWQKESTLVETWGDALAYCQNLVYAGYSDWRLPNKNELITLVDYSKADPASSFPGMTSETLLSSTSQVSYGNAGGPISVDMKSGNVGEYYSYDDGDTAVRCVRSDSTPQPAGIRECDETRLAPCKDASTGYVWSSADLDSNYSQDKSWLTKAMECRESNEGGISKWRLPTIDEVRTLLPSSESLKTDGECRVTNACFDYASEECFNGAVCSLAEGTSGEGGEMMMSSLFDYAGYITGTLTSTQDSEYAWFVNLRTGSLERKDRGSLISESRCIKDDSLPDPVEFPYTDSEHSLIWSSLAMDFGYWYNVSTYCQGLNEGGSNNWRVPTIDELKTLVKNCTDAEGCAPSIKGEYSVLGDIVDLWSSTMEDDSNVHILQFITAYDRISSVANSRYVSGNVRCVRGTDEPETEPELEFPFEIGDLIWSKVSGSQYSSISRATEYCDSLNEEGYAGRNDWTLPSTENIASLIRKSVCSNKNNFLTGSAGKCDKISFDGYSVFGDMFRLFGSNGYIDFAQGQVYYTNYPYGYVRCVVVLPDSGS